MGNPPAGNTNSSAAPLLEMQRISKRFPGVLALDNVSVRLGRGEILALMGENGAGKSTLIKVLGGGQAPDSGSIRIDGVPVQIRTIADATAHGIALIHQELMLVPQLDVASNIFLGHERKQDTLGTLSRKRMEAEAQRLMSLVGLDVSPNTLVEQLTTGQMQMVEICKALNRKVRILVLDEPTSSLSLKETERLLSIMFDLRAQGVAMLYVSHRMEEVFRVADRITVLRDGRTVGDLSKEQATPDALVSMMVGRTLSTLFAKRQSVPGERLLAADQLLVPGAKVPVSFDSRRGEILGFAGLVGSGRTELMEVLAGVVRSRSGCMSITGEPYSPSSVANAIRRGVCLVPEDRKAHGLVLAMTVAENISLPDLPNYRPRWRFDVQRQQKVAEASVRDLQIRPYDANSKTRNLSGGNQQKVVLAKWLALQPRVLILDEPTRGVDVGAKAEIYARIVALADQGLSILLVSSDLEEILGLSDRVVVMRDRRIVAIVSGEEVTKERIGMLMTSESAAA